MSRTTDCLSPLAAYYLAPLAASSQKGGVQVTTPQIPICGRLSYQYLAVVSCGAAALQFLPVFLPLEGEEFYSTVCYLTQYIASQCAQRQPLLILLKLCL